MKPGIALYLIRHGETDWNREARYQGQRDIPLNDTGRIQAKRNGDVLKPYLSELKDAEFVASPLSRAVETMTILRKSLGLPPDRFRCDAQLRELHYGHWEGQLQSELPKIDPDGAAAKSLDPFGWRPRGGESYEDLMRRVAPWLDHLERTTVAVTHGGVTRVARGALLDIDTREVPSLDVPQDLILVLEGRTMRWI